ncbi:ATP-dependent helicase HrpB [Vibrio maerlii]|uniref:ATP-dependent helicase HrpB n=1 Tax=Vibrio maerlii TaxID=2231648 RepID=UPI000E3C1716|nr:ATP-dependent helicase HrpB [Vibrio maerlii]
MSQLPIEAVMPELLHAVEHHSQVILKAAPGAGKSTYFPLQLLKQPWLQGKIIMLEPRRLAARNIAAYLASQLGEEIGQSVGYRIRGDNRISANTKLEIVTEGVMTRMLQQDPELEGVETIIFDEFHERSIHADTALAFGLEIQAALRDDLKIIVMSATLDSQALNQLLPAAQYIESEGRMFPVDVQYAPVKTNNFYLPEMAKQIERLMSGQPGSLLAFLPGVGAIKGLQERLTHLASDIDVCPLYGQLPFKEQQKAIAPSPSGRRKVVLATNIAETSLTIEGITMVVDSGFERVARFDLKSGTTRLEQVRIAQSSAEQRMGRAGRLSAGRCVRMYSENQFISSAEVPAAEILHSDLASLALELIFWGESNPENLAWLDVPPKAAMAQAQQLLMDLGLINSNEQLTELGKKAQRLGVEPRLATMLLKSAYLAKKEQTASWLSTAALAAALIEEPEKNVLDLSDSLYRFESGRHSKQRMIQQRVQPLVQRLDGKFESRSVDSAKLAVCIAFAYPDRIGQLRSGQTGQFVLANGHGASIVDEDKLSSSPFIIAIDLMRSQQQTSQIYLALEVDIQDIERYLSNLISKQTHCDWDDVKGRLVAEEQTKLGKLILARKVLPAPEASQTTAALLNYVRRKGLDALSWKQTAHQFQVRVQCAASWLPEKEWPDFSSQALIENLDHWLEPYLAGVKSAKALQSLDTFAMLDAYLGWPLNQEINSLLPTHWALPSGNNKRITYQVGGEPMLSCKLQEMFGEQDSPRIALGKKKLVLELLSPAQRPLQLTQDLAGFWRGSYKEVQKEMKGRYPKHPWPDDPANHVATSKTKKQMNNQG